MVLAGASLAFVVPAMQGCEELPPLQPDGGGGGNPGPLEPHCKGLAATCNNESCCATNDVPAGSFNRINDPAYPATVSAFRLDTYEVVIGRFRAFVNGGYGTKLKPPKPGEGAHPKIPGSGWKEEFNLLLEHDTDAFKGALGCDPELYNVWSDVPGTNDNLPVNCENWAEAFAFCIWDGGRLPTETEWMYAASGGDEQRVYPWGGSSTLVDAGGGLPGNPVVDASVDETYMNFGCQSGTSIAAPNAPKCTIRNFLPAGSRPKGKGRWGHHDLAGNVWERPLDFFKIPFRIVPCNDCADLQDTVEGRGIKGGSFNWGKEFEQTIDRTAVNSETLDSRTNTVGFRCARNIE